MVWFCLKSTKFVNKINGAANYAVNTILLTYTKYMQKDTKKRLLPLAYRIKR